MTESKCRCGKPVTSTVICKRCVRTFKVAVQHVFAYHRDLTTTVLTKGARYGGLASKGAIGKTQPLIVDGRFTDATGSGSKADHDTAEVLATWAKKVQAAWPVVERDGPLRHPAPTIASRAGYLVRMANRIATQHWAPEILEAMLNLERRLAKMIDRPPDLWYAGVCGATIEPDRPHNVTSCVCTCHHGPGTPCDLPGGCSPELTTIPGITCHLQLWAEPGEPFIKCRNCGTRHPVADRRAVLLAEAEDYEATVEMITRIVTTLGDRDVRAAKVSARIRQWATRNKITSHGTRVIDGRPRPVYRVGDVLKLLMAEETTPK